MTQLNKRKYKVLNGCKTTNANSAATLSVIESGGEGTKTEMFTWTPLSPILPGFTLLSLARVR